MGGVHRFLSRLWTVAARRGAGGAGAGEPGEATPLVRKAHWAIDKVTRDLGGPLRHQHGDRRGDGAGQRDLPRARDAESPDGVRFAVATAGSLIFPFAPHLAPRCTS